MSDEAAETPDTSETPATAESLHGAPVTWSYGQQVLHPSGESYLAVVGALKAEGFDICVDVTSVDYLAYGRRELPAGVAPERFEVVVNLLSTSQRRRVRLRVQVPEDAASLPTLFLLYPGSEAMEREVFDLMGVRFEGHPDLTRILMPEEWEGHPLRKDYPVGHVPVQFKGAPVAR